MSTMGEFEAYAVYWDTEDFPGYFVVRRWEVPTFEPMPKEVIAIGRTIDAVREKIPPGLCCQSRQLGDDTCIVEVWL